MLQISLLNSHLLAGPQLSQWLSPSHSYPLGSPVGSSVWATRMIKSLRAGLLSLKAKAGVNDIPKYQSDVIKRRPRRTAHMQRSILGKLVHNRCRRYCATANSRYAPLKIIILLIQPKLFGLNETVNAIKKLISSIKSIIEDIQFWSEHPLHIRIYLAE